MLATASTKNERSCGSIIFLHCPSVAESSSYPHLVPHLAVALVVALRDHQGQQQRRLPAIHQTRVSPEVQVEQLHEEQVQPTLHLNQWWPALLVRAVVPCDTPCLL